MPAPHWLSRSGVGLHMSGHALAACVNQCSAARPCSAAAGQLVACKGRAWVPRLQVPARAPARTGPTGAAPGEVRRQLCAQGAVCAAAAGPVRQGHQRRPGKQAGEALAAWRCPVRSVDWMAVMQGPAIHFWLHCMVQNTTSSGGGVDESIVCSMHCQFMMDKLPVCQMLLR